MDLIAIAPFVLHAEHNIPVRNSPNGAAEGPSNEPHAYRHIRRIRRIYSPLISVIPY